MNLIRPRKNITLIRRDDGPGIAGKTVEHWDGRIDAVATPGTMRVGMRVSEIPEDERELIRKLRDNGKVR